MTPTKAAQPVQSYYHPDPSWPCSVQKSASSAATPAMMRHSNSRQPRPAATPIKSLLSRLAAAAWSIGGCIVVLTLRGEDGAWPALHRMDGDGQSI